MLAQSTAIAAIAAALVKLPVGGAMDPASEVAFNVVVQGVARSLSIALGGMVIRMSRTTSKNSKVAMAVLAPGDRCAGLVAVRGDSAVQAVLGMATSPISSRRRLLPDRTGGFAQVADSLTSFYKISW